MTAKASNIIDFPKVPEEVRRVEKAFLKVDASAARIDRIVRA
jgi:hypothetical protein